MPPGELDTGTPPGRRQRKLIAQPDQVVAPHPAEALVVKRARLRLDMRLEPVVPVAQRLGVVQAPDLEVAGVQVGGLDARATSDMAGT
jgi:hypothetical protein